MRFLKSYILNVFQVKPSNKSFEKIFKIKSILPNQFINIIISKGILS